VNSNQKYVLLGFLGTATFLGFALRGLAVPLLARFEVVDPTFGPLAGTDLFGILVGVTTFLGLNRHQKAYSFSDESVTELRKVTWPSKEESVRSTTVVIITTFFIAFTLAFYDYVWGRVTKVFLFTEG